jgi:hypothetical protein
MLEKFGVKNISLIVNLFIFFFVFCKVKFEKFGVENTCLILNLITGEAMQTKGGLYFANRQLAEIDEVKILSANLRVKRKRDGSVTEFSVVSSPSPPTSPTPPSQPEVVEEEDPIPFLPSPLLRPSVHVLLDDDSRTPSPVLPKRKGRGKGKKNLKY